MTFNKCSINGRSYGEVIDPNTGEIVEDVTVNNVPSIYIFYFVSVLTLCVFEYVQCSMSMPAIVIDLSHLLSIN